ncbi:MAG TPA: Ppx/GppA phosphatase family protein [Bacteroidota bacterium]|nr:Ppx/GppA phosphatase family protein [Bacteroidota bacterium]
MKQKTTRLAAIDIGTNSFHLIIAEVHPSTGRFKILGKEKEIVRLGSGSTDMKYLSETAISRGVEALKHFRVIADLFHAEIRAIATSAVREALNQEEFLRRVKNETGIRIDIASGVEEARLIQLGVLQVLPLYKKRILLIDLGGGSTEFLLGKQRSILFSSSLKLGAVRLTERFFSNESLRNKSIEQCRAFVRGSLAPLVRELHKHSFEVCVGSSGTITTIANIIRAQRGEETELSLNNFIFYKSELSDAVSLILDAPTARMRSSIEGMDAARADIIVAGAIILEEIFRELHLQQMTVSEYALREGIILDSIEKMHRNRRVDHLHNIRSSSVNHIAENFQYEANHAKHVASLALQIFDQTKKMHGCGEEEREFLEAAALLHEVGLFISHAQHHRHSYYLIRNSELLGFTEREKEIIANIARYHRKSHPKLKHEGFRQLSNDEQQTVTKLAAILRVADGLDRSHRSLVKAVRTTEKGKTIALRIHRTAKANLEMEMWGVERKKELFEETFGKKLSLLLA